MTQTVDQVCTAAFFRQQRGIVAAVGSVVAAALLAVFQWSITRHQREIRVHLAFAEEQALNMSFIA